MRTIAFTARGKGRRETVLEADLVPKPQDGGVSEKGTLRVRRVSETSELPEVSDFQGVVRFAGIPVTVTGPGNEQGATSGENGAYRVALAPFAGEEMGISCATVPVGFRIAPRLDWNGTTRFERVPAEAPTCSVPYSIFSGGITKADVLIDARLLYGTVKLVDAAGRALPRVCKGGGQTEWDPATGLVRRISEEDAATTEVHFFREENLKEPIGKYAVTAPVSETCDGASMEPAPAHGRYGVMRFGPSMPSKRAQRERCRAAKASTGECASENFLRLAPGDRLVAFAVNHATGYAGMQTVTVPPVSQVKKGPDGKCPQDEQQGPIETIEGGQVVKLSRCTAIELGIEANVVMYPPEIDLRVERRAPDEGVQRQGGPSEHLVRHGGAATSRDEYLAISTHWRVRRQAGVDGGTPDAGDGGTPDAGDGGRPDAALDGGRSDGAVKGPGRIEDQGKAGQPLETLCADLDVSAPSEGCLRDDSEWAEVPEGVPPLAGHVLKIPQGANADLFNQVFDVPPGRRTAQVDAAQRVTNKSGSRVALNSLTPANYYVHVVGNRVFPRDSNGDGIIQEKEKNLPPPDFGAPSSPVAGYEQTAYPPGLPEKAVSLKNVYRHYESDGNLRERYDRAREHEFRVLGIADAGFWAKAETQVDGGFVEGPRPLEGDTAAAQDGDLGYEFLLALLEPKEQGRAGTLSGEYKVRLGSDELGFDCSVKVDEQNGTLGGTCEDAALEDVLSAQDILYIELYLSGNAENVLYRFNFYGIAPRVDYLSASSAYTAQRSVEAEDKATVATSRQIAQLATANFYVDPKDLSGGLIKLCVCDGCGASQVSCKQEELLKQATLALQGDRYGVSAESGRVKQPLVQGTRAGVDGARRFQLPLPPELVAMPGAGNSSKDVWVVLEPTSPKGAKRQVRSLGRPQGWFEGMHAAARGQETLGGVNLADGHLSLSNVDLSVADDAGQMEFSRTYNNQNNEPGPLGVGWTHGYEGFVLEEKPGRYMAALAGQGYNFPSCSAPDSTRPGDLTCNTDNTHGARLSVKDAKGDDPKFLLELVGGTRFRFDERSVKNDGDRQYRWRRWLLTSFEDGLAREVTNTDGTTTEVGWTTVEYLADSDLVSRVRRQGGSVSLEFKYQAMGTSSAPPRIARLAATNGFQYLESVEARLSGGTLLASVKYRQDERGNLKEAAQAGARWELEYEPLPGGAQGRSGWIRSNELARATLWRSADSAPPTAGPGNSEYRVQTTSWSRDPVTAKGFAHTEATEAVTSVVLPGHQQGHAITSTGRLERTVATPSGQVFTTSLDPYGSVNATRIGEELVSAVVWKSRVEGAPLVKEQWENPCGMRTHATANDRLQTTSETVAATCPGYVLPVDGWDSSSPARAQTSEDPRYGATGYRVGRLAHETVLDPQGRPTEQKQGDATQPERQTVFKVEEHFENSRVIKKAIDQYGRVIEVTSRTPQDQPERITWTLPGAAEGAAGSFALRIKYNSSGRRTEVHNELTGETEHWDWKGAGDSQVLSAHWFTREKQAPSGEPAAPPSGSLPRWDYQYLGGDATGDDEPADYTVRVTLAGSEDVREYVYLNGLLVKETFQYGSPAKVAKRRYAYDDTARLKTLVDERGTKHTYHYNPTFGWLEQIVAQVARPQRGSPGDTELVTVSEKVFEREPNALGTIKSVTDENGAVTRYQYDWDGRLMLVDYGGGDVVSSEAGYAGEPSAYSFGKVVASSANGPRLNHVVQVTEHDRLLRPTKSESADGISVVEAYDLAGRVVTRNDKAAGLTEHFKYQDVLGRLTLQTRTVLSKDEDGKDVVLSWSQRRVYADGAERTVEIVEAAGADGASETPMKTTKLVLDAAGRIWKRIEKIPGRADAVHQHAYDSAGRLTQYADPENRTKRWTFDGAGNLTQLVDELGYVTRYEREPGGAVLKQFGPGLASQPPVVVENGYDGFGRLVSRTLSGDSRGVPTSTWRYEPYYAMTGNEAGRGTVVETDPAGTTTTRHYNGRGKVLREARSDGTKALELALELAYDGEWPERQSETETGGSSASWTAVTERTFDARGRVLLEKESWEAKPADRGETLSQVYTTSSRWTGRVAQVTEQWATGADSGSREWHMEVDGLGNAIVIGSATPEKIEDRWGYDASGALMWEKAAGKPKRAMQYVEGLLVGSTYDQESTSYEYWPTGKLKSITGPDGRTRTYAWDARGQLEVESYGNTGLSTSTRYSYDARGKIASITYGDGTADANQWQYGHAATGELVSVSLPGQLGSFGYEYDGNRRLKAIKRPTGGAPDETFTYDYLGRLAQRTRGMAKWSTTWAAGEGTTTSPVEDTVRTLLDARGRIAREKYIPGLESVSGFEVTRRYGPRNELLRAVERTAEKQETANVFQYDGRGRLSSIARGNATVSYKYEPASDEVSRVESPGGAVSYSYDQRRRLEGITSQQRGDTTFSWEPGGERLKLVRDAHTYEKWCYDGAGRVQSVVSDTQEFNCVALPAQAMAAFEYWYDGRGNRVLESRILQGTSDVREYGYDAADRLVGTRNGDRSAELLKLSGDGTRTGLKRYVSFEAGLKDYETPGKTEQHTYEYDGRGGLKKVTVESQLGPTVDAHYTTDSAGRVTHEQWGSVVRDYGWDAAGRLVSVTKTDGPETTTLAYSYDWSGRRVSKTGPGAATTRFVWGANELLAEETGGSLRRYEQAAGMVTGVGTERVLHDGLGSAVGRVNASGSVTALYRYDAWGQLQGGTGPGSTDPSIAYAGQHWDSDVGLGYAQQRWYDPRVGRFLSEDPLMGGLANPMSLQAFGYANGNPTRYTDPTGEMPPGAIAEMAVRRNMTQAQRQAYNEQERKMAPYYLAAAGMCIAPEAVIIGAGADAWLQIAGMADDGAHHRPVRDTNYASMAMSGGLSGVAGPVVGALSAPVRGGLVLAATGYAGYEAKQKWDAGERNSALAMGVLGAVTLKAGWSDVGALTDELFAPAVSIPPPPGVLAGVPDMAPVPYDQFATGGGMSFAPGTVGVPVSMAMAKAGAKEPDPRFSEQSKDEVAHSGYYNRKAQRTAANAQVVATNPITKAQLPQRGRIRFVPPENWHPTEPLPRGPGGGFIDRFGNEWVHGSSRTAGEAFEWDVQLPANPDPSMLRLSREGQHVNVSLGGEVTHL